MIEIRGAEGQATLSRQLKEAADRDLRRGLSAGIRKAMEPMKDHAHQRALANLPRRGGLNRKIAASRLGISRTKSGICRCGKGCLVYRVALCHTIT